MAFEHRLSFTWQRTGGEGLGGTTILTADGEDNRNIVVNGGATNLAVSMSLTVASIRSIFLLSDQEVTLKTNSGTTPDNTLTLKANRPIVWYADIGLNNPFDEDITGLFLTNAGTVTANVQMRFLKDATP